MATATRLTRESERELSNAMFENIMSDDPAHHTKAAAAGSEYVRYKYRESGFREHILPAPDITDDELDIEVSHDQPVKIHEMEPDSPMAVSVGFNKGPRTRYLRGRKFIVHFGRLMTPEWIKDLDELRTYRYDLRQIISDIDLKQLMEEDDRSLMESVDDILVGANVVLPTSGVAQYQTIPGGVNRDSITDYTKVLPQTPSNFEVTTSLVNHITVKDISKYDRLEAGGDLSEKWLREGFAEEKLHGHRWISTIKRHLVPTNTVYGFAEHTALGKAHTLTQPTMFLKKEMVMVRFASYMTMGLAIGNANAASRVDFTNS